MPVSALRALRFLCVATGGRDVLFLRANLFYNTAAEDIARER